MANNYFLKYLSIMLLINKDISVKSNAEVSFFKKPQLNSKSEFFYTIDELKKAAASLNFDDEIEADRFDHTTYRDDNKLLRLVEDEIRQMDESGELDKFFEEAQLKYQNIRYKP